ncbi:glycosyltransferase [Altererythrobacter marinus]|uniref:Glycosyltransferase n=1 Tax=Pelagerythrobacter marinus TaxID=538382 RepID=A0ABW9USZ1_9SPHN|nr:glycosyltransferase family 4 protein [Pelagerythrobacter marinus]MXO67951.1 glycosyltransferase [Pelagerythrobacter marinus]
MSARKGGDRPRILHLHSTFSAGGKELRTVRLINAFGAKAEHAIVSGEPGRMEAAQHIARHVPVRYPREFPTLQGKPTPGRLQRLARAMQGYDLVLTYNWGAMNAVLARTAFRDVFALPPLIHHEDGFNEDERERLKPLRNWFRKIALGRSNGLVVPSETLERIALEVWEQPIGRVRHIPNGIDTRAFARRPRPDALRGVVKRKGERWVGTLAGLRPVKNLPRLVRAFRALPQDWHLVIVGEGPERDAIRAEADRWDIGHRVHLPGFAPDPARYVGLFDVFALSSDSEQFPISVVEAMAAGLPVAAPAVGDVAAMVAEANVPLIAPAGDEAALSGALAQLAADSALRSEVGEANRAKAREAFDEKPMIAAYRRLYSSALGGKGIG